MKKLIRGLHHFQNEIFPRQKSHFEYLAKGQNPEALFITCSDSRVNPNLVTHTTTGDLFILRNAGNIVPPYDVNSSEAATIEFAILQLKVKHIVLCGHSHCGAMHAAIHFENVHKMPSISHWLQTYVSPTLEMVKKNYVENDDKSLLEILTQENVLTQIENLKTHPCVAKKIEEKELTLHAWTYKIETGEMYSFNPEEAQFQLIERF